MIRVSLMTSISAPDDSRSAPVVEGDVLAGKYRVERVLGQGGMGVVVAATHITLHQRVALKFLLPAALGNPETIERFLREARASVRLKSEHAAKVIDVGTLNDGAPFMVMEYLEGGTLGQVVRQQGGLSVRDAVDYVLQACEAVAEAHAAGIIHRDLKPENLFLTHRVDGQPLVKVLDFGIAKSQAQAEALSLTRTSTVMGSPNYMPPEQLRAARNADVRSDIWALGAVLFELITGRVPFTAESFSELCLKVAQDPAVPPSSLKPGIPPAIDHVVLRCLEKEPAKRFQNVADLASALEPFGPPNAREMVQRVASVLGGARRSTPVPLGTAFPSVKGQTGTSWGHTSAEASSRRKTQLFAAGAVIGGVFAIAAIAAVVGLNRHESASSPAAPPPPSVAPFSPPVAISAQAAETLPPPPSTPALEVAPTSAPSAAAQTQTKPRVTAPPKPAPPPKKSESDFVFQRK
jgi:serine/threonine-protein kinase